MGEMANVPSGDGYPPLNVDAELVAITESVSYLRGVIVAGEGMLPQTRQVIDNLYERLDRLRASNGS